MGSHLGKLTRVHPREAIADRVADDHPVVAEDEAWFYGVCRRVEHETRQEIAGLIRRRMDAALVSHGVGEMTEMLAKLLAEVLP